MSSKKQQKVLLVDDEPNILIAIEFLLERNGMVVRKAYNGVQALSEAEEFVPDVVVLDVMMPEMDGFEVAKKIRANPKFENTRIVFLTAKGTQQDKFEGYNSGGEYYITKPFDNEELIQTIMEVMAYG